MKARDLRAAGVCLRKPFNRVLYLFLHDYLCCSWRQQTHHGLIIILLGNVEAEGASGLWFTLVVWMKSVEVSVLAPRRHRTASSGYLKQLGFIICLCDVNVQMQKNLINLKTSFQCFKHNQTSFSMKQRSVSV